MHRHYFYILGALFALITNARADGSFFLKDIEPLLMQQPTLWKQIESALDIAAVGTAPRIGYSANKELTGIRIAPFKLLAKPKGSKGKYVFELIVEADTKFVDRHGREVPLERAVDYKETLSRIAIREVSPTEQ
jgi:hypothetical protein